MTHHIDLSTIRLDKGSHPGENGVGCVMEWVALFAGFDKTDQPACTSPVLTSFAIAFNDGVDDETRQRLVPFIPRLVGTAGDREADTVRAWMATDWLVRRFSPAWLRKAGLTEEADALVALPDLTGPELARQAQPIIDAARVKASAAWDAAGDAAWAAAWDAAGDAAWAAAGVAAGDAAGDAAWAAARSKKGYSNQYDAAYKAARSVLDEAFAETVAELREEALSLFDRMIDVRSAVAA